MGISSRKLTRFHELMDTVREVYGPAEGDWSDEDIPDEGVPEVGGSNGPGVTWGETPGERMLDAATTVEESLEASRVLRAEREEEDRRRAEAAAKAEVERAERKQKTEAETRQRKERQRVEGFESERKERQAQIAALTEEIDEMTPHWRVREDRARLDAALSKRQQLAVEEEEAGQAAPFAHLSDTDLLSARSVSEEALANIEEQLQSVKTPRMRTALQAKRQQAEMEVAAHDAEARRRRMAHALAQNEANQAERAAIAQQLAEIRRAKVEVERTRRLDEAERKRRTLLPSEIGKVRSVAEINAQAEVRQVQLDAQEEALKAKDHQLKFKSAKDIDPGPLGHATFGDWVAGMFGPVQDGPLKGMPRVPTTDGEYVSPYETPAKYGRDRNRP